eukprot:scaffold31724_cov30-Prasinocladus_malaysianus.AAC.3
MDLNVYRHRHCVFRVSGFNRKNHKQKHRCCHIGLLDLNGARRSLCCLLVSDFGMVRRCLAASQLPSRLALLLESVDGGDVLGSVVPILTVKALWLMR